MTASVQHTPMTEMFASGNSLWRKVKFAKTSYNEFLLGEMTKSNEQSNAKYCQILIYLLL